MGVLVEEIRPLLVPMSWNESATTETRPRTFLCQNVKVIATVIMVSFFKLVCVLFEHAFEYF